MWNLRCACGLNRMDGESNESVYEKFVMSFKSERINCGVVELVKCNTFRWFSHVDKMEGDEFAKRIY